MHRYEFFRTTDRKSLYSQIKNLVQKVQEIQTDEFHERQENLRQLLDGEDKQYQDEFAHKVRSRIEEDIKQRKNALLKIKEENDKQQKKFLERSRIKQCMESCSEIREMLSEKELLNVKDIQKQQMLEKENAVEKQREIDNYWLLVQQRNLECQDTVHQAEECLRKSAALFAKQQIDWQLKQNEMRRRREEEADAKATEAIKAGAEEERLKVFDEKNRPNQEKLMYRAELLKQIESQRARIREEQSRQRKIEKEARRANETMLSKEKWESQERKRRLNTSTRDYMDYVKRLRRFEEDEETKTNERLKQVQRIRECAKIASQGRQKDDQVKFYQADLQRQICSDRSKRLREEVERREKKILENRFVKSETTREEVIAQRLRNRQCLDDQIAEQKMLREQEKIERSKDLVPASNDPDFCVNFVEKYIREGVDLDLHTHANWGLLACGPKKAIPQVPPIASTTDEPPEGTNNCNKKK